MIGATGEGHEGYFAFICKCLRACFPCHVEHCVLYRGVTFLMFCVGKSVLS